MIRRRGALVGMWFGALLMLLSACGERDHIVDVDADDPEMNAAIAQARESLPGRYSKNEPVVKADSR